MERRPWVLAGPPITAAVLGINLLRNPENPWFYIGIGTLAASVIWLGLVTIDWIAYARRTLTVDRTGLSADHETAENSRRRVRILNPSKRATIKGIEVSIIHFAPQGATHLPLLLQRMNYYPHPFDLDPGGEVYIDVVGRLKPNGEFFFCYDQRFPYPNCIAAGAYTIRLRITATDLPSREYVINASELDGDLCLSEPRLSPS